MSSGSHSRIEELHAAIATRLRRVCYDWPLDRFDAMVRNLAFITVKYERQMLPFDVSYTEELVNQMKALRLRSTEHRRRSGGNAGLNTGF